MQLEMFSPPLQILFVYHTMAVEHRHAEILKAENHTKDAVQETKEQREEKTR